MLPNAWDAGSARILEQVGFPAIARSAGIAWSGGVPDGGALDRDTMLEHIGRIVAAVRLPLTADLEAGYGDTADDVGRTVARAVELGAVDGTRPAQHRGRLANTIDAPTLFSLGVTRVSLGGSLAPSRAQHGGARRPGAARLRNARLPRRRDRLPRPATTLRVIAVLSVTAGTGGITAPTLAPWWHQKVVSGSSQLACRLPARLKWDWSGGRDRGRVLSDTSEEDPWRPASRSPTR